MTVQLNNIVNSTQGVKEYNVNMAATILTGAVPLLVYFFSGKYFVRGIAAGAVKGSTKLHSVSIKDLSLNFGSISVLKNLNIEVADGEFLVLLGPSGCGKSTLLNCIAGLLDISDGQIFIKGKNVTWEEPKDRGIGMVFQSYALYPQMTVEKNLSFGLRVAGLPAAEIQNRIAHAAGNPANRSPAAT